MRGHELLKPALAWQYPYRARPMPTAEATNVASGKENRHVESLAESPLSENRTRLRLILGLTLHATGKLRLAYRHLLLFSFGAQVNVFNSNVPVKCL